ncbi:NAD-dependent protein deacetylase [Lachnellula occidentalis]|uniref:protein acetyllysine N-acetyltransferase n=1 Tax=Lachnellula occidentalis TaxID=215460 RepID=A0A8H8RZN7_9HELO|nr:NAD-dependent protein deacetylase [Lachnellula occidentalis]
MADSAPKVAAEERIEAPDAIDRKAQTLANQIKKSKHFIAFTGAGISTSAGIPDFRGPDGAWTLRAQGRQRTGKAVSTLQAIPTPTHMALVELQNQGFLKYLVSQNCDGLHRKSGILPSFTVTAILSLAKIVGKSTFVVSVGFFKDTVRLRSHQRDFRAVATYEKTVHDHRTGRKCALCGGVLLDSIVNFGDFLPEAPLQNAEDNAKQSDLCLVLGSSITIPPACTIPEIVGKKKSAKLAICNLQETPLDGLSSMRIYAKSDDLMMRVMEKLNLSIPTFILRRRLVIDVEMKSDKPQLTVYGVDVDLTPATFLKSVKLEYNRRLVRSEPFVFNFRTSLDSPLDLKFELEFMGHYGEPNLNIDFEYNESNMQAVYLLEYNPQSGDWRTIKQKGLSASERARGDVEMEGSSMLEDDSIPEFRMPALV